MKKIALSMIIRGNESPSRLVRAIASIAPYVDGIYITATQEQKEETIAVAKNFGAHVSFFSWNDNFSDARNYAMDQVPDEYEYMIWIDDDDIVIGGQNIRSWLEKDFDCYYMNYLYLVDPKTGQIIQQHPRERIVRKKFYRWGAKDLPVGFLHENLNPNIDNPRSVYVDNVFIQHTMILGSPEEKKKLERNHRILLKAYKEEGDKHDPRTEFYLARSFIELQSDTQAEKLLWDYLSHSEWDEERAVAYQYLGEIYLRAKRYEESLQCLFAATQERHDFPWIYFRIAQVYAELENWERCLFYTKVGLDLPYPKTGMPTSPLHDKTIAMVNLYQSFFHLRKMHLALGAVNKILELHPDDEFWKEKKRFLLEIIDEAELVKSVVKVAQKFDKEKDKEKATVFFNVLPDTLRSNGIVVGLRHELGKSKVWGDKSIVYFTGQGAEEWDDTSLDEGVGGSETAVIYLSREWAKNGYEVTVFGSPKIPHVDSFGVSWRPWWELNYNDLFSIFIAWRSVEYARIKARKLFIDFHDTLNGVRFDEDIIQSVTAFLCKSEFQKGGIRNKKAREKAVVIPNGANEELLQDGVIRNPKKILYASSYDRGLYEMLYYGWSLIKKEVPDAELHTYYGWNIFDAFYKNNPFQMKRKEKMIAFMKENGVIDHGRIPQKLLMRERQSSSVHWYATTFAEIDCISVRESAIAGCIPVVSEYAVFQNNERPYTIVAKGNPFDRRAQEEAARIVIEVLLGKHEEKREQFAAMARKETWKEIAKQWMSLF